MAQYRRFFLRARVVVSKLRVRPIHEGGSIRPRLPWITQDMHIYVKKNLHVSGLEYSSSRRRNYTIVIHTHIAVYVLQLFNYDKFN